MIFALPVCASDFEITDDYTVSIDKNALLAALFEADIASVRQALEMKLITCQELTQYYLERIEEYNDNFQCFITLCDNAMDVAKERDEAITDATAKGRLFGIPIVVKDNIAYEGYPTTNGLSYITPPISEENAVVVQKLLDEGAVILGKTNMSAAAQDAICSTNAAGLQTFNAYNPSLASGGSSGGSAVAVSLNFAVAGLGTDTNASLRYPSALNGCISMRPTFGLIDNTGCILLNQSRDTVGAITRSVADQAIMLDAMLGSSYYESLNTDALHGLRIGVLQEFAYPISSVAGRSEEVTDSEIIASFDQAVEELKKCGAEIVTVSLPTVFNDLSFAASDDLYAKLETLLNENRLSAIIYPTYLHTPHYTTNEYLNGKSVYDLPYVCNCATFSPRTGAPEITVPIGRHSSGAGISMEILSLKNQEQLLLDIAYSYTEQFDHRTPSEAAPSLHSGDMKLTLYAFLKLYEQALCAAETQKAEAERATMPTSTEPPVQPTEANPSKEDGTSFPLLPIALGAAVVTSCIALYLLFRRERIFK